ncbi:Ppx/GppA phosphatase family protein [Rhodocaloribacter sp.]
MSEVTSRNPKAMRLAVIDVGTNTALLLIAERAADGRLRALHEESRFVRLGEGVDAARHIGAAALERLRTALLDYRSRAEAWGAREILVAGTSASRDAENRDELIAFVRRETGLRYEVLSGEDEARWSFEGAASAFDERPGPCVVFDVGGGSTEIVAGTPGGALDAARLTFRHSLDVGAVRLTERCFAAQPPTPAEIDAARTLIDRALGAIPLPAPGTPLIGAAGTAVSLALIHHGAHAWTGLPPGDVTLTRTDVCRWRERLLTASLDEVLGLNPAVMAGRADVFPAGVLVFERVMRRFEAPVCRISPRGLRHGLALRFFRQNRPD